MSKLRPAVYPAGLSSSSLNQDFDILIGFMKPGSIGLVSSDKQWFGVFDRCYSMT